MLKVKVCPCLHVNRAVHFVAIGLLGIDHEMLSPLRDLQVGPLQHPQAGAHVALIGFQHNRMDVGLVEGRYLHRTTCDSLEFLRYTPRG